jgi:S-layer protein (TIGR01567 family)
MAGNVSQGAVQNETSPENLTVTNETLNETAGNKTILLSEDEVPVEEEEAPKDRIWRQGISPDEYTWTPLTFSGFFYDLDDKVGTERLTIKLGRSGDGYSRSVDSGELKYRSKAQDIDFKFGDWGQYQVLGFMAEKYFAGYTSSEVVDKPFSILNENELRRVLTDSDKEYTITTGSVLPLEDGYELRIKEIDLNGNKVWLALAKNGDELDSKVVSPSAGDVKSSTYAYKVKIGGRDTPLILAHVSNVFAGKESSVVTIDGLFQISDTFDSVEDGDKYGEMKVVSVSDNGVDMENEDSFTLRKDKIVNIMGKVGFQVADSDELRFAPVVERTGTYEIRGTVVDPVKVSEFEWTPYNFEGFYYDIDDDVGTERLIAKISGSSIDEGDLKYETSPQSVKFKFPDWGKYDVIGFMADKYFAGYNNDSKFTDEVSVLNDGQLRKVLVDDDQERTITAGSVLPLEEGYELSIKEVDLDGNKVWMAVSKDGDEMGNKVLSPMSGDVKSSTFVYKEKIGSEEVPIVAVNVQSVFRGRESDLATIKGIFQISDSAESVEEGEVHGKMKVKTLSDTGITMENDGSISLGRGKEVEIMGNLKFLVADNADRNFAPVAERIGKTSPLRLNLTEALVNKSTTIEVSSGEKTISGVRVLVEGSEIGLTDAGGQVKYVPRSAGILRVEAKLAGYPDVNATLVVRSEMEAKRLAINVPSEVMKGQSFLITVTGGLNLSTMEGAIVSFDGTEIGSTNAQGAVTYSSNETGEHVIRVEKEGYDEASKNITVTSPVGVQSLNVSESPVAGRNMEIAAQVENLGTTSDTRTVELKVNGKTVDSKEVTVAPGETKKVSFQYRPDKPGVYTLEAGDRQQTVTVGEAEGMNMLLVGLIVVLLIAVGAGVYLYRTGELEGLRRRLQGR